MTSNPILTYRGVTVVPAQTSADIQSVHRAIMRDLDSRGKVSPNYVEMGEPILDTWRSEILAVMYREEMVGYVVVRHARVHRTAALELAIIPGLQGSGVGALAAIITARFVFEVLGVRKLETSAFAYNRPSWQMQAKYMTSEGCRRGSIYWMGEYHDEYLYGMTREEYRAVARRFFAQSSEVMATVNPELN